MKVKFIFVFLFLANTYTIAQLPKNVREAKQAEKARLIKNINKAMAMPIADTTYMAYQSAFWAMMQTQYKPPAALPKLKLILSNFENYDIPFRDATIEVINSLYPTELENELLSVLQLKGITTKQFAAVANYLLQSKALRKNAVAIIQQKRKEQEKMAAENGELNNNATAVIDVHYLNCLDEIINKKWTSKTALELIAAILDKKYLSNKNIIISFQNRNRAAPGLAIMRDSLGKFYFENGQLFNVPQLARAITNLPYFISNGNTPQGLYAITGFGKSKNMHIGPTDNLQLLMPFEGDAALFTHTKGTDSLSTVNALNELLYSPIATRYATILKESMIASAIGRNEIIAHGTTVDLNYYKNKPYFGFTPTMGCLQAKEIWNYQTGERLYSDQQKLVNAFKAMGATRGYLLVVDIQDSNKPVDINTVKKILKL